VIPGKSNRDLYESKEKSLMRLSEIMVVDIKMDDHITLNTFLLHFFHVYMYHGFKMRNDSFASIS